MGLNKSGFRAVFKYPGHYCSCPCTIARASDPGGALPTGRGRRRAMKEEPFGIHPAEPLFVFAAGKVRIHSATMVLVHALTAWSLN